mgnify:FL=1
MAGADGRDEQSTPAIPPPNATTISSSSLPPNPNPPPLPSLNPPPSQQQQQASSPPFSPFAHPSVSLSAPKKTSFDVGGSSNSNNAAAGAQSSTATLRARPSLARFSLSRVSFSRRGASTAGGTATPEDNTLTMRLGRLLSVGKEEWSGDALLRQRSEEEHGKVRGEEEEV